MFLNWVWLCTSEDIRQCPKTFPVVTSCRGRGGGLSILLVSSGWNPEMLFNILQHTRQSSIRKNYPAPNVSSTKVEKPSFKGPMRSEPFYLWTYPIPFSHPLHTAEWCPSHSSHRMTYSHTITILSAWNVLAVSIHGDHYFTASRPLPTSLF